MKKFNLSWQELVTWEVVVEASNREEAQKMFYEGSEPVYEKCVETNGNGYEEGTLEIVELNDEVQL